MQNLGLLILRLLAGGTMLTHGLQKLMGYNQMLLLFGDPIGLGPQLSLILVIFAEAFCSLLLCIGLFTRAATIPLMVTMSVAFFIAHAADPFQKKELAFLYLGMYVVILLLGPGKFALGKYLKIRNAYLQ